MARSRRKKSGTRRPVAARRKATPAARRSTKSPLKTGPKTAPRKATSHAAVEMAMAALAHDVRTPLTGILALAELLAASDIGSRERGWAVAIKSAAEHLAQIATVVTDAVKAKEKGLVLRHELFSPRQLVETVGAALAARAQAIGLSSRLTIDPAIPPHVLGDPVRLRAALENLVDNAVKFTAQGSITIAVAARPAARNRVKLDFNVTDSGIGLRESEIKKLFRPFSQASAEVSRRYGGTGLGLTLVKRLAKAMGGDLTVTSTLAEGSTFKLSVMLEQAKLPVTDSKKSGAGLSGASALADLAILCVEDNPYGRVMMSAILGGLGHRAEFAGSGEAALAAIARDDFDLVLMDVAMSGIDGFETTRRIRALGGGKSRVPVIGISARAAAADEERAREAGMNAYLVKPVSPQILEEALTAALS